MEFTGQAFEEMQEQNIRLMQQLREKDDANLKLMSEVKGIRYQNWCPIQSRPFTCFLWNVVRVRIPAPTPKMLALVREVYIFLWRKEWSHGSGSCCFSYEDLRKVAKVGNPLMGSIYQHIFYVATWFSWISIIWISLELHFISNIPQMSFSVRFIKFGGI